MYIGYLHVTEFDKYLPVPASPKLSACAMERKLSRYIIAESTYASSEALNSRDICSIQRENSAIQHVPSTCNTSCLSRFQHDAGFFRLSGPNLIQLATFRKFWTMQTRNVVHSQEASTEEEAVANLLVVHPPVHCKRLDLLYHFADDYFNKWTVSNELTSCSWRRVSWSIEWETWRLGPGGKRGAQRLRAQVDSRRWSRTRTLEAGNMS